MGTALVMEHANALAQMIVSEKDKLFDERVEALVKLYRRAEFYLKQGFLESIVCEFHRKKVGILEVFRNAFFAMFLAIVPK